MTDRTEIFQDLMVLDVVDVGDSIAVLVDVYGSEHNVCGSVRLRLADGDQRDAAVQLLHQWRRQSTPLILIAQGSTVTLQNDHAVFGAQLS